MLFMQGFFAPFAAIVAAMALLVAQVITGDVNETGIGWLVDYCDDDWAIRPPSWFYGKCNRTDKDPGVRDWMHITLNDCLNVDDDGNLLLDNKHHGGMDNKCDECTRCTDEPDMDACFKCRCQKKDHHSRKWTSIDLGVPNCGEHGLLPDMSAGLIGYQPVDP